MLRHPVILASFLLTVLCALVGCDSSLPPGVQKDSVQRVSKHPDFNAHIRPLLWKLSKGSEQSVFWTRVWEKGLEFTEFESLLSASERLGVTSDEELTLLWRWAREGGSVDSPEWLYSPLAHSSAEFSERREPLSEGEVRHLAQSWLSQYAVQVRKESLFHQWVHGCFQNNMSYDRFLQALYVQNSAAAVNSVERANECYLADSPERLADNLRALLGGVKPQEGAHTLYSLFEEFTLTERCPLYTNEVIAESERVRTLMQDKASQYGTRVQARECYETWMESTPAYLPLVPASQQCSYNESGSTKGIEGMGLALSPASEELVAVEAPLSALSYWIKGAGEVRIAYGAQEVVISLSPSELRLSQEGSGGVIDQCIHPIHYAYDGWNHVVLAADYGSPAGFTLLLNGKEVSPARWLTVGCFHAPASLSASGTGVIDVVKVFTTSVLSPLQLRALYDYRYSHKVLEAAQLEELVPHINHLYDPSLRTYFQEMERLHAEYVSTLKPQFFEEVLAGEIHYGLKKGQYFKNQIPLNISSGTTRELAEWLTTEASPWTARVVVNWLYATLHGEPLIDYSFPGQTVPTRWEQIDQWAACLINSGWDLQALALELKWEQK